MAADPQGSDRRYEVTAQDAAGDIHVFRTEDFDRAKTMLETMSRTWEGVEMVEILYRYRPAGSVERLNPPAG